MFITKKNRLAVYSFLFKEGTITAKKDPYGPKHSDALPIPNLEVVKLLQSFASKGYVRETFNWQWYYWYLTEEGIAYLRAYLGIPEDILPATLRQPAAVSRAPRADGRRLEDGGEQAEKKAGPGGEFAPRFQRGEGNNNGYRRQAGGVGRNGGN